MLTIKRDAHHTGPQAHVALGQSTKDKAQTDATVREELSIGPFTIDSSREQHKKTGGVLNTLFGVFRNRGDLPEQRREYAGSRKLMPEPA
jgi:hypothetical protein